MIGNRLEISLFTLTYYCLSDRKLLNHNNFNKSRLPFVMVVDFLLYNRFQAYSCQELQYNDFLEVKEAGI